jgi:MarR family transcriptional regulator for hemolysin
MLRHRTMVPSVVMPRPNTPPIGMRLAQSAKAVGRAFDDALAKAGGSRPSWLILLSLKMKDLRNQRELADAVGIEGATLTHHLDGMEADGLLTRRRDPTNRRVHLVELTKAGESAFHHLRGAAAEFDRRLRSGISDADISRLGELLDHLQDNVAGDTDIDAPSPRSGKPLPRQG